MKLLIGFFLVLSILSQIARAEMININTADARAFELLGGVGKGKANAIVLNREKYGDFKSINDLKRVSGIGNNIIEKNKEKLSLTEGISTANNIMIEENKEKPSLTESVSTAD